MSISSAARAQQEEAPRVCLETTLLELVRVVSEATEDDREVVQAVLHMLRSGSVQLCGTFRDEPLDRF
ncbi:MAG: hypothetical protein HKP30_03760 [Myxococcales bacterium]|nr:hypothetical protein [Myxococcales bacterium]